MERMIKFAAENPLCYLATIDGDRPTVRALRLWFADQTGFYFQTSTAKDFYKQMQDNPKIEACFYASDTGFGKMLRVAGNVEFPDDENLKKKVIEARPFLKNFPLTNIVIFKIAHGKGHFWTMESNMKPKEIIEF